MASQKVQMAPYRSQIIRRSRLMVGLALIFLLPTTSLAAPRENADGGTSLPSHAIVPGFERFFTKPKADPIQGGQLLLGELNCTACHRSEMEVNAPLGSKEPPVLDLVGARVSAKYLRAYLADPQRVKPGSSMPNLFAGLDKKQKQQRIEALVHFLASTGSFAHNYPSHSAAVRGEALYHRVGCVACHGSQKKNAEKSAAAVPLGNPAEKYSLSSLSSFLTDPLRVRPSGRMPNLNLSPKEAYDISTYFLKDLDIDPNLKYRYYEGRWHRLPDFSMLKPVTTGLSGSFDLSFAKRRTGFAVQFEGFLNIQREGKYRFHIASDDGSRLLIDGKIVVNHDGDHPFGFKSATVRLAPGSHPLLVEYYQSGGGRELQIDYEGPGIPRSLLEGAVSVAANSNRQLSQSAFLPKPELVERGRKLFATEGCASCHQMKYAGKQIESQFSTVPLKQLHAGRGCLASSEAKGVPRFQLSDRQQTALNAAVSNSKPKPQDTAETAHLSLLAFNCYACHDRNKIGGVERENNRLFKTTMKEMGDEGRIPPTLDGVGDKLNLAWLKHILTESSDDRPAMHARMPKFGFDNVGHLVEAFARLDKKTLTKPVELEIALHRIKSTGRYMVGAKALACVKCHDFGPHKATGIRAVSLTTMTKRLREDWFNRYMVDPQEYRTGTRMPTGWRNGQASIRDVLDGNPGKQLKSIWRYLEDADKAAVPEGLVRRAIVLAPAGEPVIYRNFIEGAGPRGIAVGYPEKINLAFDANECRLAVIWHKAFIDASKHWFGRGVGFQSPLGDHILSLPTGVPFAVLNNSKAAWPKADKVKPRLIFRSYRLSKDRRPVFRYGSENIEIEDFPMPVAAQPDASLHRTLTISAKEPVKGLWYRAAVGKEIKSVGKGAYLINGILTVRFSRTSSASPVVRKLGEQFELLIPVIFKKNQATIVQDYVW